jgi:hypothetical protein
MGDDRKGMSLHIGINRVDPDHYQGWDGALQGCEPDARDMAAIAEDAGFEMTSLLTKDATAEAVTGAITSAARALDAGDLFWLTYSGHGSQVPDRNGEEPDQLDETWVCFDRQLVDDELYALWAQFRPGVRILVLSDSCHSGSAVREAIDVLGPVLEPRMSVPLANGLRAMPKGKSAEVYEQHQEMYDDIQLRHRAGDTVDIGAHVLLISGCQDNQTSADGAGNGLFTQTLLEVWDGGKYRGGHKRFWREIVQLMPPWQSPNWFTVGPPSASFHRRKPFRI